MATRGDADVTNGAGVTRVRAGEIEISRIAYGTWRLGDDPDRYEPTQYRRKIEALIDIGVTTFDHADLYGDYGNETFFGSVVSGDSALRARMELVSKCGIKQPGERHAEYRVRHYDSSYRHIVAAAEASLRNLRTDYLDILLIHRPDMLMDADEGARALDDLVAAGKVRAIGVSNFSTSQLSLLQSRLSAPIVTHEFECSIAAPDALHDGRLDQCQERRIRPLIYSPLGGRAIFADAPASELRETIAAIGDRAGVAPEVIALAWVLALPVGPAVILGSHRLDRLVAQASALKLTIDRQDWYAIWRAATGRL